MPRNRKSGKEKVMKAVVTRLIQIDMKITDYVYNDKRISATDAAMYLQEISELVPKSRNDVKALQVIEKLTRFLNAILEEDKQQVEINNPNSPTEYYISNNPTFTETQTYCPSPVYSLLDEDITELDHMINTIDSYQDVQIETIDISDDIDANIDTPTPQYDNIPITVDIEIHRAMSSLSIKEDMLMDCSQSILNNSEIRIEGSNFIVSSPLNKGKAANEMIKITPDINIKPTKVTEMKEKSLASKIFSKITEYKDYGSQNKSPETKSSEQKAPVEVIKNAPPANVNSKLKRPRKKNVDKQNIKIKKQTVGKKVNNTRKRKAKINSECLGQTTTGEKINIKTAPEPVQLSLNSDVNITNVYPNKITNSNKNLDHPDRSNKNLNNSIMKVYSGSTENDLSWIEDIRFVREVSAEEFDTIFSEPDEFWNNYTLPGNWDNRDFNYE